MREPPQRAHEESYPRVKWQKKGARAPTQPAGTGPPFTLFDVTAALSLPQPG